VEERAEIVFADQLRQLIVGAEVSGSKGRERRRIEFGLLTDGRDELSRSIDEQRTARIAIEQKAFERLRDGAKIVFGERPTRCTNGHLVPAGSELK
jgi:hypothetical protein